jgi:AraC-like DNA-binding protein/quercetin dioxygenase-like cupin family protein
LAFVARIFRQIFSLARLFLVKNPKNAVHNNCFQALHWSSCVDMLADFSTIFYPSAMGAAINSSSVFAEVRRTGPDIAHQVEHAHQEVEFNLVVSGKGTYFLEDGQLDLCPGTIAWLLPGQPHRLIRSPDLDMWVATIHPDRLDPEILQDVSGQPCRLLSSADAVALDHLLSHISQDSDQPQLYQAGLEYVFRSAWHVTMTTAGPARKPMHPAVLQAISILRSSPETPTAAVLAKRCGVTQDYLGQLLMDHTGRGFVEWRNRIRLERFHILYPKSGDLLTAALDAGFGSYTQFHRVFTDLVGTTPGDWAKTGALANAVALPSASNVITGSDAESGRMVWYPLSELVLPAAARWFKPSFAAQFLHKPDVDDHAPRVETGVTGYGDFRQFESAFVDEVRQADANGADKLAWVFSRNDLFVSFRDTAGVWGFGPDDLAHLIGIYLTLAWVVTNHASTPSPRQIGEVASWTRSALHACGSFANTSLEDRQKAAAAFIVLAMFLRNALVGARASGNDRNLHRIAAAAHATALATLGIDLKATQIIF